MKFYHANMVCRAWRRRWKHMPTVWASGVLHPGPSIRPSFSTIRVYSTSPVIRLHSVLLNCRINICGGSMNFVGTLQFMNSIWIFPFLQGYIFFFFFTFSILARIYFKLSITQTTQIITSPKKCKIFVKMNPHKFYWFHCYNVWHNIMYGIIWYMITEILKKKKFNF